MHQLSPTKDSAITQRYSVKTLERKAVNKTALQEKLGWPAEPKRPMLCLPAGMSDALGGKLLTEILPGLLTLPVEILILGKGTNDYGALFTKLAKEEGHRVHIVPLEEENVSAMYAAADMALFLSDASALPELQTCLSYGVVPIAPATNLLENYDPIQEKGNAFLYDEVGPWHCFAAIVRTLETQKFPFDWRTIQRQSMESVS